jgi:ATP-dependent Clp protease ATP-binding subunit ClpC
MSLLSWFRRFTPPPPPSGIPFTPRAQRVLELAHEHARAESRNEASVSDVAFGLLQLGQGVAYKVLKRFEINEASLKSALQSSPTPESFTVLLPAAQSEMKQLLHTYLGTEHLLLALLSHRSNAVSTTLHNLGLDPKILREEILKELDPNFQPKN